MSIVTHVIAGFVGFMVGGGIMAILAASRDADDEHKDSWRDR